MFVQNKKTAFFSVVCLCVFFLSVSCIFGQSLKIGTFDSRAVALAFWRSPAGMGHIDSLRQEYANAESKGDQELLEELKHKLPGLQVRMHLQVFSTGTVQDILRKIEDKISEIAESAGVSLVVSKWEIEYANPAIEKVDLTSDLVALFNPDEAVLNMLTEMCKQDPVPIETMSLNPMH